MFVRAFNIIYTRYIAQNLSIYLSLGQNTYLGEVKRACRLWRTRRPVPMRTVACTMGGGPYWMTRCFCGWRQECWLSMLFIARVRAWCSHKCANKELSKAQGIARLHCSGHSPFQTHLLFPASCCAVSSPCLQNEAELKKRRHLPARAC